MDRYAPVPAALPETLPAMTRVEAQRIATKITRKFWPKGHRRALRDYQYPERAVRRVWLSPKPTSATNHDKGLGRLIHDLSHDVFNAVYPHKLPHDPLHAKYETDIAAFVAGSAWLARVMQPKAPAPKQSLNEKRARDLTRAEQAISRWESKMRRASNALKKLRAKRARLLRVLSNDGSATR